MKNIKLENVKVTGRVYAGGLAGYMEDGIIEACHVSGSVKAGYNVGGLVGTLEGGHISASSVKVKVAHPGGLDGSYWNAGGLAAENLLAVSASPSAIEKVYEDDYSNAGGLVGENLMGFISNSHAAGEVSGLMNVGGLVGHNSQGSLSRVSAEGRVTGLLFVGGVAGSSAGGSAAASWSGTEVTGNYFVGGLFGVMVEGTMSACFIGKDSAVSGEHAVGGLVGYLFDGEVTNSYSEARVTGIDGREVGGGLVGVITTLWEGATIAHCYAAGPVMDFVMMGGLVGFSEGGDIRGCYYGRESTGRSDQDNGWGIPKTTAEMKRQATFSGWDFDEMWSIVEGYTYPYLKWQDQYCFNVALAQTGAVKAGQAFAVLISNAADPVGLPLEGERKVTVTSDLEGGEEVYSGLVTFVDGTATVLLTLRQPGAHPLTVRVAGVPGQGNLDVAVEAAGGRRTAVRREESPKTVPMPVKEGAKISLPAELDKSSGVARGEVEAALLQEAFAGAEANEQGVKLVEIEIAAVEGAAAYEGILPAAVLNAAGAEGAFSIHTALGTVTVPGNLLSALEPAGVEKISLTIAAADKTKLPRDLQALIGPRPVIELGLNIDGAKVHWRNEEAPVTVSLPYTPTEEELADPEHITVWYIDGEGNGVAVPSGRYDPVTGKVTFSITHFSRYAVVYVKKTFADLEGIPWAKKQIEVLASRGVMEGLSKTAYAPQEAITRGDFLYALVRALDLSAGFAENFADVGDSAYYYREIGIAKKLGITKGTGANRFSPEARITRQDMMVLAEKALRLAGRLQAKGSPADLESFADRALIADYAVESAASLVKEGLIVGSEGRVNPLASTTRAEAAALLYRMYNNCSP